MIKKVLFWGSIAFAIFFVAYRPESAAGLIRSTIPPFFHGMADFLARLVA